MSLYELFSTFANMPSDKPRITDDEYEEGMEMMRGVLSQMPDVRL